MDNKVGLPKKPFNRVKIGLSICTISDNLLTILSKDTKMTKSQIVEESLVLFNNRQEKINTAIKDIV